MTYTVKYKLKNQWFWRTISKVKGDASPNFLSPTHLMIIREDESIVMLPVDGLQIKMGPERHTMILQRMEQQAGQTIPISKTN